MSLETLLEAAKIIESRSKEDEPYHFHPYAKKAPTEVHVEVVKTERGDSSQSFDFDEDEDDYSRERRRPGGAGTREVHNKLEKNRRAHLKECFNFLKKNIPTLEERRTSNLGILRGSLRYIQTLRRKEREHESEMQKLAGEKIGLQGKIQALKGELQNMNIEVDLNAWMTAHASDNESHSTSTATEGATPPPSDHGDDDDEEEADLLAMETNPSPVPKVLTKRMPQRMPSVRELLNNGRTSSSKVVDAIQGLMAANKVNHNVRPLLPHPATSTSTSTINSEIPQTLTFKTTPSGQLIIPKQLKIPVSLALTTDGGVAKSQTSNISQQLAYIPKSDLTHTMGKTQQSSIAQQLSNNTQTVSQQKSVSQPNVTQLTTMAPQQISLADLAKIQEQVMLNIEKQAGLLQKDGHPKDNNNVQLAKVRDMTKLARLANIAQKTGNLSQQTANVPQQTVNVSQQTANVPQQMANFTQQARLNQLANIQSQLLSATSMTAGSSQQMNNTQLTNIQQPSTVAKQPVTVSQQVTSQISTLAQLANIVEQTSLIQSASVRDRDTASQHTRVGQQTTASQQTTSGQQTCTQQTTVSRPPVTQILHQTLTQRQALAKQSTSTPQAPVTAAKLKSPHLSQALIPVSMATTVAMTTHASVTASQQTTPMKFEYIATPVNMAPTQMKVETTMPSSTGYIATPVNMISTPVKLDTNMSSSVNLVSVPIKLDTAMSSANQDTKTVTTAPMSLSVPYYMASLPKFAHPILVTSLTAPTLAALVSTNAGVTPVGTIKTETASSAPVAMVTSSSLPALSVNQVQTSKIIQNTPLAAGLQVRPFLASNFLSGQFLPLIAHTIPQTSISATPSSATITTTVSGQFTTVPIMSLAQINPLTQIVSPVTVMSPGMQLGSAGLTQQQINNMFSNSSLLKQFAQVPVLTPSLLPQGQVLGQQVVKPVVMVTLPNMVTTSALSLPTTSSVIQSDR